MKKKIIISVLFSIIIAVSAFTSYAADTSNKTEVKGLGNEITSSINETEDHINNFVDEGKRGKDDNLGKKAENMVKDLEKDAENTTNKVVGGITGNYGAGEVATVNGTEMSRDTWIWMILAAVSIVIIAAVWYYAAQRND